MYPFPAAHLTHYSARPDTAVPTTPAPVYPQPQPPVRLVDQPARMDHHEKMQIRAAAFRATRLYSGPVGELVSRELLSFEEFGLRLGTSGSVMRAVNHILKTPMEPSP